MSDLTDDYRARMAAAHQRFTEAALAMLTAYGGVQDVFGDLLRSVDGHFAALHQSIADVHESNEELKKLIMEQGAQLREQGTEIRALRADLNNSHGKRD